MKQRLVYLWLVLSIGNSFGASVESLREVENDMSEKVSKTCKVPIRFDLHDYTYGTDELSTYGNLAFEDCGLLKSSFIRACEGRPKNTEKISKIKRIICQRGSLGERKLILRKNGELTYLIARNPKETESRDTLLEKDMERVLGIDFKEKLPQEIKKEEDLKSKVQAEAKAKALAEKRQQDQSAKITAMTTWFQTEVKKLTDKGGPDLSANLEKLTKEYQEKMNDLTK